ncbi:DUF4870 domain-containing protein [Flavobacterium alkalisoli]|uniref:DUF4870 domain-containing protein n=1 Tax=Flavobacterium alkalisoli TaxID=2602769 RepID=A0A5B9FXV4_9FLAO|nr:DUF4870 domain-containing protein [Flavobacterium alkalisoli]QEE49567.1 DUF4870 domain-containing protein [Flavobacterium alkalisoli]
METTANRNTAILMQLSAYTQYFIPLGNFIFPVIIWSIKKQESKFVDYNGKQIINFQLSLLVYSLLLVIIAVPLLLYTVFSGMDFNSIDAFNNMEQQFTTGRISGIAAIAIIAAVLFITLKFVEFFLIIYASVKNSNGENYNYPFTIKFIK